MLDLPEPDKNTLHSTAIQLFPLVETETGHFLSPVISAGTLRAVFSTPFAEAGTDGARGSRSALLPRRISLEFARLCRLTAFR